MKISDIPPFVQSKLWQLDEDARGAAQRAEKAAAVLARQRKILNDDLAERGALKAAQAEGDQILRQSEEANRRRDHAESILRQCREWLDDLGSDVMLEEVKIEPPPDANLADVRSNIGEIEREIDALRRAATPSRDIRERIEGYVNRLAESGRPFVRGIGAGETLEVLWPQHHEANREPLRLSTRRPQKARQVHSNMTRMVHGVSGALDRATKDVRLFGMSLERWISSAARLVLLLTRKVISEHPTGLTVPERNNLSPFAATHFRSRL
jgi:hypothetical protein